MLPATQSHVSTSEVAKALGVGVSTVKRWVNEGVLPAHRTVGGHRKLLVADVLELARRSELPHADLSKLLSGRQARDRGGAKTLAGDLYTSLLAGNMDDIRSLLFSGYRNGVAIEDLADNFIRPAMQRIGEDWQAGKSDVWEEHRASSMCAAALCELKAMLEKRVAVSRPLAVGGAAEGDQSVLPTLLSQMVLLDAGWEAVNLGVNTPFTSLTRAIKVLRPTLVWISACHLLHPADFVEKYRQFYELAAKAGVAVAIGGRAIDESIRRQIPYTTYGDGMSHLAAFARTLHPRPRLPRRGRPVA